jgi:hypothetical protein
MANGFFIANHKQPNADSPGQKLTAKSYQLIAFLLPVNKILHKLVIQTLTMGLVLHSQYERGVLQAYF